MSRFDRYLLSQFLIMFSFFALVLVSIYWINRAVRLFDDLIADGQSALVFLEFTALGLPNVIRRVLPMSVFAAVVYVTNRLSNESELTVMQATGFSPWRLARPVTYFGIIIALMMSVITHFLVPASLERLGQREHDIAQNATARLLNEGTFLHPAHGVTFYIREITPEGALQDIFLSDRRQPDQVTTYTASEAYLVSTETGPKLVMVNGLSQFHKTDQDLLFTTHFEDFTYDIGALIKVSNRTHRRLGEIGTFEIFTQNTTISEETKSTLAEVIEEAQDRFVQPLQIIAAALIGFATLLVGGYSRFGVWRKIIIAFVLLLIVSTLQNAASDMARDNEALWAIVYLPSILAFSIVAILLLLSAHPTPWRHLRIGAT